MSVVRPEDCFTLPLPGTSPLVGTSEVSYGTVPTEKNCRVIYGIIINNHYTTAENTVTIRQYKNATLEQEWAFIVSPGGTLSFIRSKETPILVIPAGREIKVVASNASATVLLMCYDR